MHIELNTLFVEVAKELAQNPWANSQTGRQNFDHKSQVRIRKKKIYFENFGILLKVGHNKEICQK